MILHQFYLNCLAHASYLDRRRADRTSRRSSIRSATSISTWRSPREHGLRIAHVFLTHFHADFIAGHLELRDRTGATIYLGAAAKAEYAFTPLARRRSHRVRTRPAAGARDARATRRSRSRSSSYDLDRSATEPHAVLTGDTLFVGDVGRPDLRVALGWSATDLGGLLYDSLRNKLLPLPDASLVYPAHGAGSLCGKALSKETVSTIGEQRRVELRAAADDQGGVRRARHGRSARRAALLHLRRRAEQQGAADARRDARARAEADDARSGAGAAGGRRADARHARSGRVRRRAPRRAASTSASAASTRRGPARS